MIFKVLIIMCTGSVAVAKLVGFGALWIGTVQIYINSNYCTNVCKKKKTRNKYKKIILTDFYNQDFTVHREVKLKPKLFLF